ncbi:hypothetical protein F383_35703 [Gossypium arboreum]|uniref:Uncharacterized protein n=1 Tax=Gossypium arboreum TaxID=29729 RepID=A0A0B0N7F3_GOSAR|nr:hypothetical protein F383_35703 [Gossypium arboreum]
MSFRWLVWNVAFDLKFGSQCNAKCMAQCM